MASSLGLGSRRVVSGGFRGEFRDRSCWLQSLMLHTTVCGCRVRIAVRAGERRDRKDGEPHRFPLCSRYFVPNTRNESPSEGSQEGRT